MTIQLYCFGESGHSYKAALALTLTGCDWTPVQVDFFGGEARGPEFRALNPMGECPVYVEDGLVLTQSGVILDHIVHRTGMLGWANEDERREVLRWVLWDNHKLSSQAGAQRFMMNFLPEARRSADVLAHGQGRLRAAFKVLDEVLAGRAWVAGTQGASIADLSCCSYLYYPEPFGFDRADWPNIDRWLDDIAALPGWQHPYDLMPGSPADRA